MIAAAAAVVVFVFCFLFLLCRLLLRGLGEVVVGPTSV
jgi:hypothetical protein